MKAKIDLRDYAKFLPEGWVLDGTAEWPPHVDDFRYRVTAFNRRLDGYVRLSFALGTPLDKALRSVGDACRGFESAMAEGMER